MNNLPKAFEDRPKDIALEQLLPTKALPESAPKSTKYRQIAVSIGDVGLIEPIVVSQADPQSGLHMILDGHLRLRVFKELERPTIPCLIALDDEGFTYNKRVNRIATIQEHYMIQRALERGVDEARLARALNVEPENIRMKRSMLDGICAEVIDMLKDKRFDSHVLRHLRKMKTSRQIEATELMVSLNNYTTNYAAALLAATPQENLVDSGRPKTFKGVSAEQMARMEQEMSLVQRRFKTIEQSYGTDVLNMVVIRGYIAKLLSNAAVVRFLQANYPEFLTEFRAIVATGSLEEVVGNT